MQPTKSKSTRYQPKGLYLAASILLACSAFYNIGDQFFEEWCDKFTNSLSGESPIHWREGTAAIAEAKRTSKPILYAFLAKRDTFSLQMYGDGFHDPKVAQLINENFVPVRVDFDPRNYDHNSALCTKLQNQFGYHQHGELLVVPAHMTDMSLSDVESSGNLSEMGVDNIASLEAGDRYNYNYNNRYRGCLRTDGIGFANNSPKFVGYTNKRDLLDYLYESQHWHRLPPTKGQVAWQPQALATAPLTSKPRLIAFVDNAGAASDNLRLETFWDKKDYNLINANFEPVLVEFRHGDADFNRPLDALKAKYGITSLPALVIESQKLPAPLIQFGHSNYSMTREFLEAGVKKVATKALH